MIVNCNKRYTIATKEFPLVFDDGTGKFIETLEGSALFYSREGAQKNLDEYEDPEPFQILEVEVSYRI